MFIYSPYFWFVFILSTDFSGSMDPRFFFFFFSSSSSCPYNSHVVDLGTDCPSGEVGWKENLGV